MSRHAGHHEYALCDYREPGGRRCRAFILPPPRRDPMGPGAVIAGYLDVTEAAQAARWRTGQDGDFCPEHAGETDPADGSRA